MRNKLKRLTSVLLALVMTVGLLPTSAFALGGQGAGQPGGRPTGWGGGSGWSWDTNNTFVRFTLVEFPNGVDDLSGEYYILGQTDIYNSKGAVRGVDPASAESLYSNALTWRHTNLEGIGGLATVLDNFENGILPSQYKYNPNDPTAVTRQYTTNEFIALYDNPNLLGPDPQNLFNWGPDNPGWGSNWPGFEKGGGEDNIMTMFGTAYDQNAANNFGYRPTPLFAGIYNLLLASSPGHKGDALANFKGNNLNIAMQQAEDAANGFYQKAGNGKSVQRIIVESGCVCKYNGVPQALTTRDMIVMRQRAYDWHTGEDSIAVKIVTPMYNALNAIYLTGEEYYGYTAPSESARYEGNKNYVTHKTAPVQGSSSYDNAWTAVFGMNNGNGMFVITPEDMEGFWGTEGSFTVTKDLSGYEASLAQNKEQWYEFNAYMDIRDFQAAWSAANKELFPLGVQINKPQVRMSVPDTNTADYQLVNSYNNSDNIPSTNGGLGYDTKHNVSCSILWWQFKLKAGAAATLKYDLSAAFVNPSGGVVSEEAQQAAQAKLDELRESLRFVVKECPTGQASRVMQSYSAPTESLDGWYGADATGDTIWTATGKEGSVAKNTAIFKAGQPESTMWNGVDNLPSVIIHGSGDQSDVAVKVGNSSGYRFDKTCRYSSEPFDFKVLKISDDKSQEVADDYVVTYYKMPHQNSSDAISVETATYAELKEKTLQAGNSTGGYVFLVPSGYYVRVEEQEGGARKPGNILTMYDMSTENPDENKVITPGGNDTKNSMTLQKSLPYGRFHNDDTTGGNVHVIVDYNLDGRPATTVDGQDIQITGSSNPTDCGTVQAGDQVHVVLTSIQNDLHNGSITLLDSENARIYAKFKGVWTTPDDSGEKISDETSFDFTVPGDMRDGTMLVLYVHWDVWGDLTPVPCPCPDPNPKVNIFPVYFDFNYTGGGITSIEVGTFTFSTKTGTYTITYGFTPPDKYIREAYENSGSMAKFTYLRQGWEFLGWSKDPEYDEAGINKEPWVNNENHPIDKEGNVVGKCDMPVWNYYGKEIDEYAANPTGPMTFYGIWIPYDIIWDANGGWFPGANGYNDTATERGVMRGDLGKWVDGNIVQHHYNNNHADAVADGIIEHYSYPVGGGRNYVDIIGGVKHVPQREGYEFEGWYYDPTCMIPINEYEVGLQPARTYFAGYKPDPVYVNYYDTREGGTLITTQEYEYGDTLDLLKGIGNTDGQTFMGWKMAINGSDLDGKSALVLTSDGNANGEGSLSNYFKFDKTVTTEGFAPTRKLLTWHPRTELEKGNPNSDNVVGGAHNTFLPTSIDANGYWTLDLVADWQQETARFEASIDWSDYTNNDGVRPQSVKVGLLSSLNNSTVQTYDFTQTDAQFSENFWAHTFEGLPITTSDASVEEITYSVYLISYVDQDGVTHEIIDTGATSGEITVSTPSDADTAVFTTYRYGINNYMTTPSGTTDGNHENPQENNRLYAGKISFNHDLITTGDDIQFTMQWKDDSNNDGQRPQGVTLILLANGEVVSGRPDHNFGTGFVTVSPAMCDVSADGNTWTYTFKDYQKYDNKGERIDYTVRVVNDNGDVNDIAFDANGYTAEYLTGDAYKGDPNGVILSRASEIDDYTVDIVWDDELNRDGLRPESVTVVLKAYQYNDKTYRWEEVDVDTREVTGDMTAGAWHTTFEDLDVHRGGYPIIYKALVGSDLNAHIPDGNNPYSWVGNDLVITISHNRSVKELPVTIEWDDKHDQDNIRPTTVLVRLYADGVKMEGAQNMYMLSGDETDNTWHHTFTNLPVYRAGNSGEEIIYTIGIEEAQEDTLYGTYINMANGEEEHIVRYTASYLTADGATTDQLLESGQAYAKLTHDTEQSTTILAVSWHDDSNRDGKRPSSVQVDLYKQVDGEREFLRTVTITAGSGGTWSYRIKGLPLYENGEKVLYLADISDEFRNQLQDNYGYTCSLEGSVVHLYYSPETGYVNAKINWEDNDNNDGIRPDHVVAYLYANGVKMEDSRVELNESNGWAFTWRDLDAYYRDGKGVGQKMVYSVKVEVPEGYADDYIPETTTTVDPTPIAINLSHDKKTGEVASKIFWSDNRNQDGKRPDSVQVQLYADGEPVVGKVT